MRFVHVDIYSFPRLISSKPPLNLRNYVNDILFSAGEWDTTAFSLIMDGDGISHEQRNWMIAFVLPIQIVATILLWIRLLSRFHRSGGQPGFDDVLLFVGWVLGTCLSATVLLGMASLFREPRSALTASQERTSMDTIATYGMSLWIFGQKPHWYYHLYAASDHLQSS